jgi:hypothetical protein
MNKRRTRKNSPKVGPPTVELFLLTVLVTERLLHLYHQTGLT